MSARVRWECPHGLHPGVLGSSRPRKNATVRYCLPCSESEGVLVERVAPAVERKRAARSESSAKRAARRERERAARDAARIVEVTNADGTAGTLDVEATMKTILRLPVMRERGRTTGPWKYPPCRGRIYLPEYEVRRRGKGREVSGHAYPAGPVYLSFKPGLPREEAEELILHELCHYVLPSGTHHGASYRSLLVRAAREFWPCDEVRAVRNEGAVYDLDARLWEAAREAARSESKRREAA